MQLGINSFISCRELRIISVLSRCLGRLQRWPKVLKAISDQGFNAVHFTPIQEYGMSRSQYSLAN